MKLRGHFHFKHPKRVLVITICSVLGILLITYGVLSYTTWHGIQQGSETASQNLKSSIDTSLGAETPTGTPEENIDSIIKEFEDKNGSTPCQVAWIYSWQTVFPGVKSLQEDCQDQYKTSLAVIDALQPLGQFLKDQKVAAQLVSDTAESTAAPTDLSAAATTWSDLANSTELPSSPETTALVTLIKTTSTSISDAYKALATANSSEDKTSYDTAYSGLQTAYQGIAAFNTSAIEQQGSLTTTFTAAYDKL